MGCQARELLACIYRPIGEQLFTAAPALKRLGFTRCTTERTPPSRALHHASIKGKHWIYHQHLLNKDIFFFPFFFFKLLGRNAASPSQTPPEHRRLHLNRAVLYSPVHTAGQALHLAEQLFAEGTHRTMGLGWGMGAGMSLFLMLSLQRGAWPLHEGSRLLVRAP